MLLRHMYMEVRDKITTNCIPVSSEWSDLGTSTTFTYYPLPTAEWASQYLMGALSKIKQGFISSGIWKPGKILIPGDFTPANSYRKEISLLSPLHKPPLSIRLSYIGPQLHLV